MLLTYPSPSFFIYNIYYYYLFINILIDIQGDVKHPVFKLLGLKWLPVLTQLQAQELSPYEVGEQLFHSSLANLMSSPALLCALRQRDAFASLKKFLPYDYPGNLSVLISSTPEVAFRQASLFFEPEIITFLHA